MNIGNYDFIEFSKFDLLEYERSIVILCKKSARIPFAKNKNTGFLHKHFSAANIACQLNSLSIGEHFILAYPRGLKAKEIIFFVIGEKLNKNLQRSLGSKLSELISSKNIALVSETKLLSSEFLIGLAFSSYVFGKYKSSEQKNQTILINRSRDIETLYKKIKPISEGVFFTRDLTNEPSNFLNTEKFAQELLELRKLGVNVTLLNEAQIAGIGMNALLHVGKGSINPSLVVSLEWNGNQNSKKRLALVGKGVMFDSGGISLKPAGGMQEMTGDMGGAATIAGVFKTLALRKSKSNLVGLLGLVENMPSSDAMKPGDVVQSLKGDFIEIVNTDAEGRLVLADLIWYCQKKYKISGVIDIATLTGAVEVALGNEYCGLFSNSSVFRNNFLNAAKKVNEKVWEMPIDKEFNKLIKSRIADIKNSGGRLGGAITAAMFIYNFVKKSTPWIHLDIAGVSYRNDKTELSPPGATGWGVLTIDKFVELYFEK